MDCMELMKRYADNHFELAIVDPPYGIGDFTNKKANKKKGVTRGKFGNVKWNNKTPNIEYFNEVNRVSKNQIIWGANYYNCFHNLGGAIVWYKHTKHPKFSDCEIASTSMHKRVALVDIEWYSLNRCEETIHPCQKPVQLYKWLLKNYAKEGDKILDTHMGSGSIAIACHYMGFDLTACELDKEYYEQAMQRIEDQTRQKTLI